MKFKVGDFVESVFGFQYFVVKAKDAGKFVWTISINSYVLSKVKYKLITSIFREDDEC